MERLRDEGQMLTSLIAWSRANRVATLTIIGGALAVGLPYWSRGITWIAVACALGGSIHLIARRATGDKALVWLLDVSFGIRCLVGVILFAISSLHFPILQSLPLCSSTCGTGS